MSLTIYTCYLNPQNDLVVEVAVPGRVSEDLDISIANDSVVVTLPAKSDNPASLLGQLPQFTIINVAERWKLEEMSATCRDGLLRLIFPSNPIVPAQDRRVRWEDFIRQQKPGVN